jgi:hypothetical protein
MRRRHHGAVEEAEGRGAVGNGGMTAREKKGGRRPEEGDGADGWAPSVGERERGGKGAGAVGPKGLVGRGLGWAGRLVWFFFFFFLFFSNSFQTNFKPCKFKSFSCFQTQILTQIYSTI